MNAGPIIKNIAKYGPIIAEAAGVIYGKVKEHFFPKDGSNPKVSIPSVENLAARISDLEKNEIEQAEFVQKMANQINDISMGMKVLYNRTILSIVCSSIAILLGVIILVLHLYR